MQEDANKALSTSVQIDNRKVKLAVADKKPRQRDNYEPKNKDKKGEFVILFAIELSIYKDRHQDQYLNQGVV